MTIVVMAEAVERDACTLLAEYDAGSWEPSEAERVLADGLARSPWDGPAFRAVLHDATYDDRQNRLIDVLDPAVAVFENAGAGSARLAVLTLRRLGDALAD
ncbi:hypothetical protein [Streptomyces sp. NPDC014806]|uniref:hypothetical protein n=1 Tax=Streptomyces sp. NPDC014806 TaxID=3364920 RepID=UPI0036F804E1